MPDKMGMPIYIYGGYVLNLIYGLRALPESDIDLLIFTELDIQAFKVRLPYLQQWKRIGAEHPILRGYINGIDIDIALLKLIAEDVEVVIINFYKTLCR